MCAAAKPKADAPTSMPGKHLSMFACLVRLRWHLDNDHSAKKDGLHFHTKMARVVYDVTRFWNAKMADRERQRIIEP